MFSTAEFAAESGFVDEVVYERVMDERLAKLIDVDKKETEFCLSVDTHRSVALD